ncbi:MAG: CoA-binding protein [Aureispira sp.]|nr:CoA-binding protein [Aureispira sp.]
MKTVILGASPNAHRYAYKAVQRLTAKGHEAIPVGIRKGNIEGIDIVQGKPALEGIHTITLYINPTIQEDYFDYILSLHPKRIIFNPGTENPKFYKLIQQEGPSIEIEVACTLVMLAANTY